MKTILLSLITTAALALPATGFATTPRDHSATATVEFLNSKDFTDFKTKLNSTDADRQALERELRKAVQRDAAASLPAGFHLTLRFRDIDLAGDFEPGRNFNYGDIRIVRDIYPPRLSVEYVVADATGNVVASGERQLTDLAFQSRIVNPALVSDQTYSEQQLLADFIGELGHHLG